MASVVTKKEYIPDRNDIAFLDFNPTKGKEIGNYRPALVLTSKNYNSKLGLLICCPISTSIRGYNTEVTVDNLDKPCVVAANLVHTLSWKDREIKFKKKAAKGVLEEVLLKLSTVIGADKVFIDHTEWF